jgi:kynurenine formamidase
MRYAIAAMLILLAMAVPRAGLLAQVQVEDVKDLSLLVSKELPCTWPIGMSPISLISTKSFGLEPFHRDLLLIDEHTGTQWDAPAHFVPPPDSGLPGAGPMGSLTGEKVPAWQFCGEACVVDVRRHCDEALEGSSYIIEPFLVHKWEQEHRPLKFGDVVMFRSDYSDRYYRPFPEGKRFIASALRKETAAWPAPSPETMTYLADKGVMTLGLDGPSMGPLPDMAVATHQAGGQRGLIWVEGATNLGSLPPSGSFIAILAAKHAGGSGGECRCVAITDKPLASRLNDSARRKRVVDLSVTLHEDYPVTWPGQRAGEEASRYVSKTLNAFGKARGPYFAMTHLLDTQAGTHIVLPSYSLPENGFDESQYTAKIRKSIDSYAARFGARGFSSLFVEQVSLSDMMGEAHVIDVRSLRHTTRPADWPSSPLITVKSIQQHEAVRPIRAGDVVLFYSGYSDEHFRPLPAPPELDQMFAAPLAGETEGWPALTAEAINYLSDKGIRCIGTDGPTLGGVNAEHAWEVYWLAAAKGVLVVEFLTNVGKLAEREAFFMFAPVKIRGARSGYGRALALY